MTNATLAPLASRLAHEFQLVKPLLPTYIHLLASAVLPIFIAAHASLARPSSAAPRKTKEDSGDTDLEDENEPVQKIESLAPSDAVLFPLLAGVTLTSLYFLLKWLQDPTWLNWLLGLYFAQLGLFFGFKFIKDTLVVARSFIFPTMYSWNSQVFYVDTKAHKFTSTIRLSTHRHSPFPGFLSVLPLPQSLNNYIWSIRSLLYTRKRLTVNLESLFKYSTPLTPLEPLSLLLSIFITSYHTFVAKPWPLTNFLGISFCYSALQYTSPTTAWTGTLILAALFVYDIYFVFFTPMMVTVATKLDVPIKLLFPRPDGCVYPLGVEDGSEEMQKYILCKKKGNAMAMLGLGDIVVPGMVIAFALRFDLYLHYRRLQKDRGRKEAWRSATGAWGERFWTRMPTHQGAVGSVSRRTVSGEGDASRATGTETSHSSSAVTRRNPSSTAETSSIEDSPTTITTSPSSTASATLTDHVSALQARSFPKPYFHSTLFGYLLGLISTILSMQIMSRAQPALLYLVPGVAGALWGCALWRGEGRVLWGFSEDEEKHEVKRNAEGVKGKEGAKKEVKEGKEEEERKERKEDEERAQAEVIVEAEARKQR